jgi:uncharacterized protein YfiM (DUF2279 family)
MISILLIFIHIKPVNSQILPADTILHPKRLYSLVAIEGSLWGASVIGLNYIWYKDYDHSAWHSFNDQAEWLQIDKVGHFQTSYYLGKIGYDMLRWSGVSHSRSVIYGGSLGFFYLTSIEMLDAYSQEWGFSWGDMAANALGSGFYISQALLWKEQRISVRFSFHPTDFAQYRPNVLGDKAMEQLLKDYNGHTYWLSANIYSFLPDESTFPKWLNVAVGYGAQGMLGGFSNPTMVHGVNIPSFDRYRQYYLSLDIDWTKIPTHSKFLKSAFNVISFIKFPMPTLQFDDRGTHFYPLYF